MPAALPACPASVFCSGVVMHSQTDAYQITNNHRIEAAICFFGHRLQPPSNSHPYHRLSTPYCGKTMSSRTGRSSPVPPAKAMPNPSSSSGGQQAPPPPQSSSQSGSHDNNNEMSGHQHPGQTSSATVQRSGSAVNSEEAEAGGLRVSSDEINFLVYRYLQESGACM
jgi:hypothetical protein